MCQTLYMQNCVSRGKVTMNSGVYKFSKNLLSFIQDFNIRKIQGFFAFHHEKQSHVSHVNTYFSISDIQQQLEEMNGESMITSYNNISCRWCYRLCKFMAFAVNVLDKLWNRTYCNPCWHYICKDTSYLQTQHWN